MHCFTVIRLLKPTEEHYCLCCMKVEKEKGENINNKFIEHARILHKCQLEKKTKQNNNNRRATEIDKNNIRNVNIYVSVWIQLFNYFFSCLVSHRSSIFNLCNSKICNFCFVIFDLEYLRVISANIDVSVSDNK